MTPTEKLCIEKFEKNNIISWKDWDDFKTSKHSRLGNRSPVGFVKEMLDVGAAESEDTGWRAVYSYMQHLYGSK